MARIYRRTDRIKVKVDDITVSLAPLSAHQKAEITQLMVDGRLKTDVKKTTEAIMLAIKYSMKSVEGIMDADNKPYALQFEGDALTQDCLDDLLNMELSEKLQRICSNLSQGVPNKFTDERGNPIEGVEVVSSTQESAPKNA
jgi:hypothetical protein